jgi:hypothetical protein
MTLMKVLQILEVIPAGALPVSIHFYFKERSKKRLIAIIGMSLSIIIGSITSFLKESDVYLYMKLFGVAIGTVSVFFDSYLYASNYKYREASPELIGLLILYIPVFVIMSILEGLDIALIETISGTIFPDFYLGFEIYKYIKSRRDRKK